MAEAKGYILPGELYYTKGHTWARVEEDGTITVGLDDFGAKAAGQIEFIDLPTEGDFFKQGDAFGRLESAKWVGNLVMPITGTIKAVNQDIQYEIELLKNEPYGKGWLLKVIPSNLKELEDLFHGEEVVQKWLEDDLKARNL